MLNVKPMVKQPTAEVFRLNQWGLFPQNTSQTRQTRYPWKKILEICKGVASWSAETYFLTLTQSMFTLFYSGCFFDNISILAEMMFQDAWQGVAMKDPSSTHWLFGCTRSKWIQRSVCQFISSELQNFLHNQILPHYFLAGTFRSRRSSRKAPKM